MCPCDRVKTRSSTTNAMHCMCACYVHPSRIALLLLLLLREQHMEATWLAGARERRGGTLQRAAECQLAS